MDAGFIENIAKNNGPELVLDMMKIALGVSMMGVATALPVLAPLAAVGLFIAHEGAKDFLFDVGKTGLEAVKAVVENKSSDSDGETEGEGESRHPHF